MLPVEIPMGDGTVFFFDAGAVILIILAIIIVPRLLGGSKKKDTTALKSTPAPKAKPAPKPAPTAKSKAAPELAPAPKPKPAPKPAPVVIAKKMEELHRTCPYCGCAISKYTTPGQPYPFQFECWDCKRHFGDTSRMTEQELALMKREEADCRRVEQLPNLQQIKEACHTAILDRDVVCLTIDHGSVEIVSIKQALNHRVIAHYDPISTYAGNMHLTKLCMEYCRSESPYFTYSWMDKGFCRE